MNDLKALYKVVLRLAAFLCICGMIYLSFGASRGMADLPDGKHVPRTVTYHSISDEVLSPIEYLFVTPSEFDAHLSYFDSHGYEYLFAEEWSVTDSPSVVLTFDDGYFDNYTTMLPILKEHGAKATVFLITEKIGLDGYLTVEQIREMSATGLISFQSHGITHRVLPELTEDEIRRELSQSRSIIEEITGKPVSALSYPEGRFTPAVERLVSEYYSYAYSTEFPNRVHTFWAYTIPRYYVSRGVSAHDLELLID